jgi:UDP-2,3-diacylglucosamine hydrolase
MSLLFVSDLHLDAGRPAATRCFEQFLASTSGIDALYILGDLFETWIGDDVATEHDRGVLDALRQRVDAGMTCAVVHGNRDFLLGSGFIAASGARLLGDETVLDLFGRPALLMHGDTLCTDDLAYQRYRRWVHDPRLQTAFLALPGAVRRRVAEYARARSRAANAGKPPTIMDVNQETVVASMRRNGVNLLIHGHTHRPARHAIDLGGQSGERYVLGDWYTQGSALRWTAQGAEIVNLRFG